MQNFLIILFTVSALILGYFSYQTYVNKNNEQNVNNGYVEDSLVQTDTDLVVATTSIQHDSFMVENEDTISSSSSNKLDSKNTLVGGNTAGEMPAQSTVASMTTALLTQKLDVLLSSLEASYGETWYKKQEPVSIGVITSLLLHFTALEVIKSETGKYPEPAFLDYKHKIASLHQVAYFVAEDSKSYQLCNWVVHPTSLQGGCFTEVTGKKMISEALRQKNSAFYSIETLDYLLTVHLQKLVTFLSESRQPLTDIPQTKTLHLGQERTLIDYKKVFLASISQLETYFNQVEPYYNSIYLKVDNPKHDPKTWMGPLDSYIFNAIPVLLIAYYNENKTMPTSLVEFLPTGYIYPGRYTVTADRKDYSLCPVDVLQKCVSKFDGRDSLFKTLIEIDNDIYLNKLATLLTSQGPIMDQYLSTGVGLGGLSVDLKAYKTKEGNFPPSLSDFVNSPYFDKYRRAYDDGYFTIESYESDSSGVKIFYKFKHTGIGSIEVK